METNKGFSLVELVIVIAVISIVLSITAPYLYKYGQNTNLKEATRELAGDITLYRQTSIAENVRYRIVFSSISNRYAILKENPANSGAYGIVAIKSPGSVSSSVIIMGSPNDPSFSGGVPYITIQPRGTMGAGTLRLQHTSRLSTSTITTNLMGKVNVTYDLKY